MAGVAFMEIHKDTGKMSVSKTMQACKTMMLRLSHTRLMNREGEKHVIWEHLMCGSCPVSCAYGGCVGIFQKGGLNKVKKCGLRERENLSLWGRLGSMQHHQATHSKMRSQLSRVCCIF